MEEVELYRGELAVGGEAGVHSVYVIGGNIPGHSETAVDIRRCGWGFSRWWRLGWSNIEYAEGCFVMNCDGNGELRGRRRGVEDAES